ncbi:glycosyltransferase family 39 protein [Fontivita pretiosa]|uniref:glycosyltransferase family 39 protein n=1 Tax=Fontivita pretiosa TaxID=2989684 RepID=UPI003D1648CB
MTEKPTTTDGPRMRPEARLVIGDWTLIGHWGLIVACFLVMLAWSWFGWPDPLVDFGRELYLPWQILAGKVLYRDIAHFNGPLSAYFNTLVFALLGVSLRSIVIVNLILLALLTWLVWRLIGFIADRFAATVACIVMLTVFAFIQLGGIGNYNFVTPYSHELTHGLVLSFVAITCFAGFARRKEPNSLWLMGAGLALGMVFLTKPEVFVAAALALGTGIALHRPMPAAAALGGFVVAAAMPILIAFLLLAMGMPEAEAIRGVLGAWIYLFDSRITRSEFYARVIGTHELSWSLIYIVAACAAYAIILLIAARLATIRRRGTGLIALAVCSMSILVAIAFNVLSLNVWQGSLRGLTVVSPLLAGGSVLVAIRKRDAASAMRAVISVFAAALLAKIVLNVTPFHYGFALAMPATLLAVAAALSWWPQALERRGGSGAVVRAALLPVVGLFIFVHLYIFGSFYSPAKKRTLAGSGPDAFRADPPGDRRGAALNLMLGQLADLPAQATLVVVPEGVMINYLARRENPTPYLSFMPPEVAMFGQARMLATLDDTAPDYVIVSRVAGLKEYGYEQFGQDFGRQIFEWIDAHYDAVPLPYGPGYPFELMKRKQ